MAGEKVLKLDEFDLDFDFGFTAVTEDELEVAQKAVTATETATAVESKLNMLYNSILPLLSNAKNETSEYYTSNPGSYEVYTPTDLILDYLKDIKTVLTQE